MMKFRKLDNEQKDYIRTILTDERITREKGQEHLAEKYKVHARTIRKWSKRMGINVRNAEAVVKVTGTTPAKILIVDLETAPMVAFIWNMWNFNLGQALNMMQSDWFLLTWSAKWLFDENVYSDKLNPEEVKREDDGRIVKSLWILLNEAEVVIAHNGKKFDVKKWNTRFLMHKLPPPMPYQVIDTLEHVKRQFAISSNKLDYVAKVLGLGSKVSTGGFDLWRRCMQGDSEALLQMEVYNRGDVTLLEDVYLAIRSWVKPHPNMGLFILEDVTCCPTCASEKLKMEGTYKTYANTYDAFRCEDCGAVGRLRKTNIIKNAKNNLTLSTP